MFSAKKTRVLALAVASLVVLAILFRSQDAYGEYSQKVSPISTEKTLIDSQHKDSVDEAINKEISKLKHEEATGGVVVKDPETPPVPVRTQEKEGAPFDAAKEFLQIRALAPMTIFSKTGCPFSRRLKKLLSEHYTITPQPQIVELDKHKHGRELQEYVGRVTGRRTVPNVILGTTTVESRGGCEDFELLHSEGKLQDMLNEWGEKAVSVTLREVSSNL